MIVNEMRHEIWQNAVLEENALNFILKAWSLLKLKKNPIDLIDIVPIHSKYCLLTHVEAVKTKVFYHQLI